jgi:hypothetical protein
MSINSMTNAAIARRPDFPPVNAVPRGLNEIAGAAGANVLAVDAPTAAPPANATATALNVLFGYIPTEVLTVYLAFVAAIQQTSDAPTYQRTSWIMFYIFLAATPVVVWVVFAGKLHGAGKPVPVDPALWPLWEMTAGTIAYVAWAFALPNSPFKVLKGYNAAFASIAVLAASTLLGLLAQLFTSPLKGP